MKLFKILVLAFFIQMQGQEMFKDFEIKNITINTKKQNFGTAFFKNNTIVFSSENTGKLNLFVGRIENGDVSRNMVFRKGMSNHTHESNVAFTNDFKTVYFTKSSFGKENTKRNNNDVKSVISLYKADLSLDGTWSNIQPLPFNNKNYHVGHPTLNKENTKLYFSSNMPGGIGKSDIYVVDILGNNEYSKPKNLGSTVNTKGNELHPFISGDNFLYFSSNGHSKNLGGMDIYVTQVKNNNVSVTEHVNEPINSRYDDFSFIIDYNKRIGFFSSNRPGGKGQDDIYYFKEKVKEKKEIITKPTTCNQFISGTIFLNATQKKLPNTNVVLYDSNDNKIESIKANTNAEYKFKTKCNQPYIIKVDKEGYKKFKKSITSTQINNKINNLDISLVETKKDLPIKKQLVKPGEIGFNFNEAKLLKRYVYQLDKAIILMIENPNLYIEIESHTDSRAEDELNMELTERRIENIVEYIATKGISTRRIRARAFGETKPVNKCVNNVVCTEEEYLENRRTTFKLKEKKK
jgi:outer membrane protein OmpA-like peptidoglycan-associated protein